MKSIVFLSVQTMKTISTTEFFAPLSHHLTSAVSRSLFTITLIFTLLFSFSVEQIEAATRRYYCKMSQGWWTTDGAAVGIYAFGNGDNGWPGVRMTSDGNGQWHADIDTKYTKVIFTRINGSGTVSYWSAKTGDLTLGDDNYYTITSSSAVWDPSACTGSWSKYAPTPAITGSMNSWKPDANIFSGTSGTVTCNVLLLANKSYEFKVITGTTYYGYGSSDGTDNYTYISQTSATTLSSTGNNLRLLTAGAGTYIFTYNCSSHTLSVSYPTVTHPNSDYVYFKNVPNWDPFKVHLWGGTVGTPWGNTQAMPSFTFDGQTYYYTAIGDNTNGLVTKKANDEWDYKTSDLSVSSHKGQYFYVENKSTTGESEKTANWKDFTVTITLDQQSATTNSNPTTYTPVYNSTVLAALNSSHEKT